jgi:putative ABC transport system permease protein
MDTLPAPYYIVTEDIVDALGTEIVEGRTFNQTDFDETRANEELDETTPQHYNIVVSKPFADAMYPDGDALGKQVQSNGGERVNTIVGIMREMHNSWMGWEERNQVMLIPGRPGDDRRMRYAVRVEPAAVSTAYTELEELMLGINPGRIVSVRTLAEIKKETFAADNAMMNMLTGVIFFLILVTSLGIVGLTASAVTQRTRQIGTRRALGATKVDIVRYFLVENWLITGFGLAFGVAATYGLNYLLVHVAEIPKMDPLLLVGGVLLLWLTGVLAALVPALKATSVAPEVATRTV